MIIFLLSALITFIGIICIYENKSSFKRLCSLIAVYILSLLLGAYIGILFMVSTLIDKGEISDGEKRVVCEIAYVTMEEN